MKKLIFTLIALATMTCAMAQSEENVEKRERGNRPDPKEMAEKRTQDMVEKYALSTEQAAKVKALNEKYMSQMGNRGRGGNRGQRPDMQNGSRPERPQGGMRPDSIGKRGNGRGMGQRGERFGQRGERMKQYNEELRTILNEAQYKAYEADQEKMMKERRERFGNNQKKD